jgi:hypothetical protein
MLIVTLVACLGASGSACSQLRSANGKVAEIVLSASDGARIEPTLFGVNYVWHLTPANAFPRLAHTMREGLGATLVRYPGGWSGEAYDWDDNRYDLAGDRVLPNLDREALDQNPGVDPRSFLSLVPQASFVTASAASIRNPARIDDTAQKAARLVRAYGRRVGRWEIGNEWWLQRGAKHDPSVRSQNLDRYAALVRAAAPAMKSADPAIAVFVTADWVEPEEVAQLRRLVGQRAWRSVDGVSIHPYCGDMDPETLCSLLPQRVQRIRDLSGREPIYASEWSLGRRVTQDDFGIRSASRIVKAFRTLAEARVQAAAYWPAVRGSPEIALVANDDDHLYANGVLFGWMARYFRGVEVDSSGPLPSAAARQGGEVTIVVATMDSAFNHLQIPLGGRGLSGVVSAEAMSADRPDDPEASRLVSVRRLTARTLPTSKGVVVDCDLSRGAPRGDARWQIVRITLN